MQTVSPYVAFGGLLLVLVVALVGWYWDYRRSKRADAPQLPGQ